MILNNSQEINFLEEVDTSKAPKAVGPYAQGIKVGNIIYTSGQIGIDPSTNKLVDGLENQVKQALSNIQQVLIEGGSSVDNIIKTTLFLTDIETYKKVNEIYAKFMEEHRPARSTVEVSNLPLGALFEIEVIALV